MMDRETLRAQRAEEYFKEAARPFLRQIQEVMALHQRVRIYIHADGTSEVETWLPPEAAALVLSLRDGVELCRRMADDEARRYWP